MAEERATIFALSSGQPPAAIGVIRISGPEAGAALDALAGRRPAPRRATVAWLRDAVGGERLDRALMLWFPGPRTATGEDLAELHIHSGRSVASAVQAALARLPGCRPALAGEFTRRAFENGVIDLAEAEGLADLLAAETEDQRRAALALTSGQLSRQVDAWRRAVLGVAARLETMLDFADEGAVEDDIAPIEQAATSIAGEIDKLLARPPAERLRDGLRVVLAGPPNAGKSTLLNALIGRDAAITSPEEGTTRDLIEMPVAIGGIAYLFTDTAGLRESGAGAVERIGVARARDAIAAADVLLWLGPPSDCPDHPNAVRLHPMMDLNPVVAAGADLAVSARTGEGLDALLDALERKAQALVPRGDGIAVNARQRDALALCAAALREPADDPVLLAESLRSACRALDRVTGRAGVEDMLDILFGQFCIGK